ncbi:unnamed protein product [Urochloa decumbens]|uniref:Uncharacterized protein n=1 Tax=Urochloa decumbens TaxID=240449 RepID=A0ABC8WTP3_9POAL
MAATANPDCSPAADDDRKNNCNLFRCICCWSQYCGPHFPRFAPGLDFIRAPAADAADDRPPWSVLVGCVSITVPFHNLRLHRFRVAASGRVLGRTDDTLQPLLAVSPDDEENNFVSHATAALGPDGRRLYGVCTHFPGVGGALANGPPPAAADAALQFPHRAFAVDLDAGSLSVSSSLPPLPFSDGSYLIVSARGELWAPSVEDAGTGDYGIRLVVRRLEHAAAYGDGEDARWEEVAGVDMVYQPMVNSNTSGYYLQGYAVVRDRFILLSLINFTFFCFDCAAGTLTPVTTAAGKSNIPIPGKAVHCGGDDGMVYFVRGNRLYAYDFSPEEGKLLAPPVEVQILWPYYEEGYGSLVHLAGRMMCAVWINMDLPCGCAERHALITTFLAEGGRNDDGEGGSSFVPSGVRVLHSTCRRVGMLRSSAVPRYESFDYFCFLQEYLDHAALQDPSIHVSSTNGGYNLLQADEENSDDDNMPNCCRRVLSGGVPKLKECKSLTKPELYFICQVDDRSLVYQISIIGGKLTCHEKLLEPLVSLDTIRPEECAIEDPPPSWHFVHQGSKLYVIPSIPEQNHYEVDVSSKLYNLVEQERPHICFSVVSRAGQHIVALGDTLQDVYVFDEQTFKWLPFKTSSGSVDLTRKIYILGFVDLTNDMLLISDAGMEGCFLLDLSRNEWFVVKLALGLWQNAEGVLFGKCLFAQGFIYSCTGTGFNAFELLKEDTCYCLGFGWPIWLEFPYVGFPDRKLVCFDSICEEDNPRSLVICALQGCVSAAPFTSRHRLATTTVEVKLEEAAQGRKRPIRIDHIDISDFTIDNKGWIWTNFAFSL